MTDTTSQPPVREFFGHPGGLFTLFFTEMWERMSYYGMRGILVLFMTATVATGGLALNDKTATAIYGLYTGSVYFLGIFGGWMADRMIGGQRAVWYGGLIIMSGHIVLAIPSENLFFIGLMLVAIGTGLLKPNIGAMVGQLYASDDDRRDAGYALYYMGINVGSFIGGTVCGYLASSGQPVVLEIAGLTILNIGPGEGWHWAFGAAAVGMGIGLIQYKLTQYKLNTAGVAASLPLTPERSKLSWMLIFGTLGLLTIVTILALTGTIMINAPALAGYVATLVVIVFLAFFARIYFAGNLTEDERKCVIALFLVCVASVLFWAGFEHAGSSFNLFAERFTDRSVTLFGNEYTIPTAWFQNLNPAFIVILTPFFAALWINLGKRMILPSYGLRCAIGVFIMATGFIVMFMAAQVAASGMKASPNWLVAVYFIHTVGELCLSPVALSAVSKLSPRRFAGQMMGLFVLTYSIGSLAAGLLAGEINADNLQEMPSIYLQIGLLVIAGSILVGILAYLTRHWDELTKKIND